MSTAVEPRTGSAARLLSLSGALAVVTIVVAVVGVGGDSPTGDDPAAEISRFYDTHEASQMIAAFLLAATAPLFALFGLQLAGRLSRSDGRHELWTGLLRIGGLAAGTGFGVAAFIHVALTQTASDGVTGGAIQAINELDNNSWVAFNGGLGILMLGAAGALLARRAYPVLAWIALACGIALYIPFADFFALLVSGLWIIVTSVLLYLRRDTFGSGA